MSMCLSVQFSCSVVSDSLRSQARQASLSITNSRSSLRLMSVESVMPSSRLVLWSPSPPAPNHYQHQGLFQSVNPSHEVAKVLEFQPQHQSFQWTPGLVSFRMDWLALLEVQGTHKSLSSTTAQKHQFFSTSFLHSPTLTSIHDHWKNPSLD